MNPSAREWIDIARLDELTRIIGLDNVDRLLTLYRTDLQRACADLKALLADRDFQGLRSKAHQMRGAALNLGCQPIADAAIELSHCQEFETVARLKYIESVSHETIAAIGQMRRPT